MVAAQTLFLTTLATQGMQLLEDSNSTSRVDCVDQYELASLDLNHYSAILISMMADQRLLLSHKEKLRSYLHHGGTLVVNGHIAYKFIDELDYVSVVNTPALADFAIKRHYPHPVFSGINTETMNSRKGVCGFWSRASNPPPENAKIIHSIAGGTSPIDWEYNYDNGGRLFVHSGNDMWMTLEDENENLRLFTQLLDWIEGESE